MILRCATTWYVKAGFARMTWATFLTITLAALGACAKQGVTVASSDRVASDRATGGSDTAALVLTESESQALALEAKTQVKQFATQLKAVLQSAMKRDGPVSAIAVCNTAAPAIADSVSESSGWDVARTSHRVRNSDNQPDPWEASVMAQWNQAIAEGTAADTLSASDVQTIDGKQYFRFMKAIPTEAVCLNCHGQNLAEPVTTALKKLYPNDQAVGFSQGEMRGAFTLKKLL